VAPVKCCRNRSPAVSSCAVFFTDDHGYDDLE